VGPVVYNEPVVSLVIVLVVAATGDPTLTLDEAVRIARTSHPKVDAARAQLDVARAQLARATSAFLPALTGGIGYSPQTGNTLTPPGLKRLPLLAGTAQVADTAGRTITTACVGSSACTPAPPFSLSAASWSLQTTWFAGVGAWWNLWDWGATPYARRAARFGVEAQHHYIAAQQNDVGLDAKLAYFTLLAVEASIKVAQEAVATEKLNVEAARVQAQNKTGLAAEVDVATALADLAKAELALVETAGSLSSAQAALTVALGQASWHGYQLAEPPPPPDVPPPPLDPTIAEAEAHRAEPRQLAAEAQSYWETERAVRGQLLPQLVLQGGVAWTGDATDIATNGIITLSLSYPVTGMNPFAVRAEMREAEANRAYTLALERQARNDVSYQVAGAISEWGTAQEALGAVRLYLDAGRRRYQAAQKSYAAGSGDIVQLSEATFQFIDAELRQVTAKLNFNVAQAKLDWSLGGHSYQPK
jgi:outer membrane protein TolC